MEEQVQVKAAEDKQETSPQEKEAAVLDAAVKEGEVSPDYGLQPDGVYKVNLDKPQKPKEDAVQSKAQMRYLYATDPKLAKRFKRKTKKSLKSLPEKINKKKTIRVTKKNRGKK